MASSCPRNVSTSDSFSSRFANSATYSTSSRLIFMAYAWTWVCERKECGCCQLRRRGGGRRAARAPREFRSPDDSPTNDSRARKSLDSSTRSAFATRKSPLQYAKRLSRKPLGEYARPCRRPPASATLPSATPAPLQDLSSCAASHSEILPLSPWNLRF